MASRAPGSVLGNVNQPNLACFVESGFCATHSSTTFQQLANTVFSIQFSPGMLEAIDLPEWTQVSFRHHCIVQIHALFIYSFIALPLTKNACSFPIGLLTIPNEHWCALVRQQQCICWKHIHPSTRHNCECQHQRDVGARRNHNICCTVANGRWRQERFDLFAFASMYEIDSAPLQVMSTHMFPAICLSHC